MKHLSVHMRLQLCQLHFELKQQKLVWIGLSWNVYLQTRCVSWYLAFASLELECYVFTWVCWAFKEEGKPKINYVTVFERPGLKEFLRQLSEFADLVLFTAGLEGLHHNSKLLTCIFISGKSLLFVLNNVHLFILTGYARPLVDRIDMGNWFSLRLYRPSTIST